MFSSLIVLAGCQEDPDAAANKLFVEASTEVAAYHEGTRSDAAPSEQLAHLQTAIADLNKITSDYPSTNVAVKVVSLDKSDDLYLPTLQTQLEKTKRAVFCDEHSGDISCRFDPLVEKQIAEFDPMNIGDTGRALIFTLAATDRYDDLLGILKKLKSVNDVSMTDFDAILAFCQSYGHSDVIDRIDALSVSQGHPPIDKQVRAQIARLPKIIKASAKTPVPDVQPGSVLKDRVERLYAMLQNGDDQGAQEEMKKIYVMLFAPSNTGEDAVTAEQFLKLAAPQLQQWSEQAMQSN